VTKGAQIGQVGTTGLSTGAHLHFQVEVSGKHQNPVVYLLGKGASTNTGNLSESEKSQFGCVPVRNGNEIDITETPSTGVVTPPVNGGGTDIDDGFMDLLDPQYKCQLYSYFMEQGDTPSK
jgi:hypothetical protein